MPTLKIDNRRIEVPAGTKVLEAAERLGIIIPRFCYHPALGSVGACRVCAVSFLEGPIKGIQMSCMVNAMDGMVVSTTDAEAVDFRKHVIEWLMLNHPHDCPVCDEGGHCLLQDLTVSGGHGLRRYQGAKRTHRDQYLGPLVQHEMNRCIQCYRCVRYYQKYAGYRDLGVMGIGTRVYFGRSKPGRLESPFAGNLIDICPTGVYTDKPSRFIGRRWDFQRATAVCPHCSLGCNLVVSARYREIVRHEARPNPDVNGHFICDRGRYGYPYANAADRPRQALVKGQAATTTEALALAGRRLEQIAAQAGPQSVAVVGTTRSSLETLVALEALCRDKSWIGPVYQAENRKAVNLKAAVRHLTDDLAVSLGAISVADAVVVIGADPLNEAPMLALSLRQASQNGGHITIIDPRPVDLPLDFEHWPIHPQGLGEVLRQLIRAAEESRDWPYLASDQPGGADDGESPDRSIRALARRLMQSHRAVVVCGTDIINLPDIDLAAELARVLHRANRNVKLFFLLEGPNAFAAGLRMEKPTGLEQVLDGIEAGGIKALVVVENDLWADACQRERLAKALDRLELLIVWDRIATRVAERAHIFLPTQTAYEAGGLWVNQEGRLQRSRPAFVGGESITRTGNLGHPPRVFEKQIPGGAPIAAWRLAAHLAGRADLDDRSTAEDFLASALEIVDPGWREHESGRIGLKPTEAAGATLEPAGESHGEDLTQDTLTLLLVDRVFGTEPLSARSAVLAEVTPPAAAVMHPRTAEDLCLGPSGELVIATESGRLSITFGTDARMAPGVLVVPRDTTLTWQVLGGTRLELDPSQVRANSTGQIEDETQMKDGQ
jgi:NADH-quinone oxidoreductase subunit G